MDDWHVFMGFFWLLLDPSLSIKAERDSHKERKMQSEMDKIIFFRTLLYDLAFQLIWNSHLTWKETELAFSISPPLIGSSVFSSSSKITINVITRPMALSEYTKANQARKLAIPRKNKANNLILPIPEKTQQQSKEARQGDWAKFQKGKREKNRKKLSAYISTKDCTSSNSSVNTKVRN